MRLVSIRVLAIALVGLGFGAGVASRRASAQDVGVVQAPPMAPFKRGPLVEGTLGVYAPTGRLKRLSAPGPWMRVAIGYDISKWLAVFVAGDAAFLTTGRAPPPPGERGYVLWGFSGGVRLAINVTDRVRIPVRLELGAHRASDGGVLGAYGFSDARDLGLSWGGSTGLEWRAASRHYGIFGEVGIRNDSSFTALGRSESPFAIVSGLGLHYTL